MEVIVIGAGVVGATLAFALARAGARVTVLDAGAAGGAASAMSFGWVNASYYLSEAHFRLRAAAIAAHHRLGRVLGHGAVWQGAISWEAGAPALAETAQRLAALGYPVERLEGADLRRRLPALGGLPSFALGFPAEGAVDPAELAHAALGAVAGLGGRVVTGLGVTAIDLVAGGARGVVTPAGRMAADHVVVAAGLGSAALVSPCGLALAMPPRPGLLLRTRPLPPLFAPVLVTPFGEVRQDRAGRILAPAAAGHQGDSADRPGGDPRALAAETLARLAALLPGTSPEIGEIGIGWRPVPGDGLPVVGAVVPGLSLAVMHSGATLAPVVAELLGAEIMGGAPSPLLSAFRPRTG